MVVGYDEGHAEACRVIRLDVGADSAVHGHDDLRTALLEHVEGVATEPVTLVEALWDVEVHVRAQAAQAVHQQCGCADAVRVVVAEDGDAPARPDGVAEE